MNASVIKDTGARAILPVQRGARGASRERRPLRRRRGCPARRRVGGGPRVSARAVQPLRGARLPRPEVPRALRRPGRRPAPRRRVDRGALAGGRVRRGRRRPERPRADRDAARVQLRHLRAARALDRARDQGRARRGARDHRAGCRLGRGESADLRAKGGRRLRRQRRQDLHHQRRTRRLPRLRGEDDRGRRPPRHLVPRAGAGHARLRGRLASWRRWAGTPPTPGSSASRTSRCPRRTCSGPRTRAST